MGEVEVGGGEAEGLAEAEVDLPRLLGPPHRSLPKFQHLKFLQFLLNSLFLLRQHQRMPRLLSLSLQLHQPLLLHLNNGYLMQCQNAHNHLLCVNMGSSVRIPIADIPILLLLLLLKAVLFSAMKLVRRERIARTKIVSKPMSALLH